MPDEYWNIVVCKYATEAARDAGATAMKANAGTVIAGKNELTKADITFAVFDGVKDPNTCRPAKEQVREVF